MLNLRLGSSRLRVCEPGSHPGAREKEEIEKQSLSRCMRLEKYLRMDYPKGGPCSCMFSGMAQTKSCFLMRNEMSTWTSSFFIHWKRAVRESFPLDALTTPRNMNLFSTIVITGRFRSGIERILNTLFILLVSID